MVGSVSRKSALKTMPEYLFYLNKVYGDMRPPLYNYYAVSTKSGRKAGQISLFKTNLRHRPDYSGPSLGIGFISATPMQKGVGTVMMNFAKNISKKWGCNGYICLSADVGESPNAVPHLFYRKNGFTTLNREVDRKMDKFINKGKVATYKDFRNELMLFPPPEQPQKGFWKRIFQAVTRKISD